MQILNWPHTLQRALAKLWLKAISSASLQNWLCCSRAALSFQHSSPYTVLNVSFKVPTRFPANTSGDIIFQRNTLCTELQSCTHVSWDRPHSFSDSTRGLPCPTAAAWAEPAHLCVPSRAPLGAQAAGQQHHSSRASPLLHDVGVFRAVTGDHPLKIPANHFKCRLDQSSAKHSSTYTLRWLQIVATDTCELWH